MRSTEEQVKDFEQGPVWHDIEAHLEESLDNVRTRLETEVDPIKAAEWRAIAKATREYLDFPNILRANIAYDREGEQDA